MDITFPTTCKKDMFDNKYRYNAISIGLISDWIQVSHVHKLAFRALNKYKLNNVHMNLLKNIFYHILGLLSFWTLVLINTNPKLTFV